jgi:cell division septal protein FtsQ
MTARAREMLRSVTAARIIRIALIALTVLIIVWLLLAAFFGYGTLDGGVGEIQTH